MPDILLPIAEPEMSSSPRLAPRLDTLSGGTVGVVDNSWRCMHIITDEIRAVLPGRFGVRAIEERRISAAQTLPPGDVAGLARSCDAVIVGIGN